MLHYGEKRKDFVFKRIIDNYTEILFLQKFFFCMHITLIKLKLIRI
jgi:hypothetical protein